MTDPRAAERCPSRADLLCAIEGELSAKERVPLLSHLRRCAICRLSVDEIPGYVELVAAHIDRSLDSEDVRARFNEFLQRLHRQKQALIHAPRGRSMRRWLPVAAVIPMLIVGFLLTWTQDVVKADELVTRAISTERAVPAGSVSRARLRTTPANPALLRGTPAILLPSVTMPLEITHGVAAAGASRIARAANDDEAVIAKLLADHHFDLQRPLSIDAFQAWRGSLARKEDRVSASGDHLVLHTSTPEGTLSEADLTVRRDTFHVVRLMLTFEGIGRVVVEEVAPPAPRQAEAASVVASAAPPPPAAAAAPAAAPRITPTTASTPVTKPSGRAVSRPELSTWRARTFGDGAGRTTFVPLLTQRIASVKTRLQTLRELAAATPDATVEASALSDEARALRQKQVDETYVALSDDLEELNTQFSLLFGSPSAVSAVEGVPADWARRANSALPHAEALERLVDELLTHDDLPPGKRGRQPRHPIAVTFGTLWNVISAADRQPSR